MDGGPWETNSRRNLQAWAGRLAFPLSAPNHCTHLTSGYLFQLLGFLPTNFPCKVLQLYHFRLVALLCLKCPYKRKIVWWRCLLWVLCTPDSGFCFLPSCFLHQHFGSPTIFWHDFLVPICSTSSYQSVLWFHQGTIIIKAKLFLIPLNLILKLGISPSTTSTV